METIVINEKMYPLVADGYQLGNDGGRVIFQPGGATFDEIEMDLAANDTLKVLDDAGAPLVSRSDLVYAGRLTRDSSYPVGTEQVQVGEDEAGEPIYEQRITIGTVIIAEFRAPDVRETCAALEAQLQYVAMMSDIDMEV